MFRHDCPLAMKPESTPRRLVHKKTWRDSLPIDILLSAVSVLVAGQPSSEVPEGLMNYPVYLCCQEDINCRVHLPPWRIKLGAASVFGSKFSVRRKT
jgi:hypothetical protein